MRDVRLTETALGLSTSTVKVTSPPVSGTEVGLAVLVTSMLNLALVNVHFTVSPGSILKVAVRAPISVVLGVRELPSSQERLIRENAGDGSVSTAVKVPGTKFVTTICPLSEMIPAAVPVKVKLPREASGLVCFSTIMIPLLVLVK